MDPKLKLSPERNLVMTFALRQALEILQMPQLELGQWLRGEIEKNPLLELKPSSKSSPLLGDLPSPPRLHDHLMRQVRESFRSPLDQMIAEELLEHLDERGFLSAPLEKIATFFQKPLSHIEAALSILQTFDPPGICARNLQESLLLQLKAQGALHSPTYLLIRDCFDDLLHGRFSAIKKKLDSPAEALAKLARLHFRPADLFRHDPIPLIIPDIQIAKIDGGWTVELLDDELPKFTLQTDYLTLAPEQEEEKETLRTFSTSAKWLIRSLTRRKKLLSEIGRYLVCKQARYLNQKGKLIPTTLKEISQELHVHESTLSRALSGKYAATPRGIIPLRSLITLSPTTQTAQQALAHLIAQENKQRPYTDDQLASQLTAQGLPLARRTIAKYRRFLKIGPANQRKNLAK
ncbi:MAG TPA: RNA polymerase factor sigma-54 [Chlamydiales bacterium]|nr:RNA polymerase factor sigma-54 [Chlamydiales bacterium]